MIDFCKILNESKTIAIVGLSRSGHKTSRVIAEILSGKGYIIYGVNPFVHGDIEGFKFYKSLKDIPVPIDIVNVFMRSENIPNIIQDVMDLKPKVLWLQQGIRNDYAVKKVIEQGIITIQDECISVRYSNCNELSE